MKYLILLCCAAWCGAAFGQVDFRTTDSGDIIVHPKGGEAAKLAGDEYFQKTGDLTASEGTYTVYASKSGGVVSITINVTIGTSVGNQVDVPSNYLPSDWKPSTTVTFVVFDTAALIVFQVAPNGGIQMNRYNLTPALTNFVNGQLIRTGMSWSTGD